MNNITPQITHHHEFIKWAAPDDFQPQLFPRRLNPNNLILQTKKQLDQQFLVQFIPLFFGVLKCHDQNSLLFITGSDYSRFPVLSPIRSHCLFGIMTVDNTSEKPIFYGLSDVLSTSAGTFFSAWTCSGGSFVDSHVTMAVIHCRSLFCVFYFQHYVQVT